MDYILSWLRSKTNAQEELNLDQCRADFPIFESPGAKAINHLLRGDWNKGEYGVLVRTTDLFDEGVDEFERSLKLRGISFTERPALYYLPASFLHASMRASQAIFQGGRNEAFTTIIATKYKQNRAMNKFQGNGSVDCQIYYPADAGTVGRGTLEHPNATFCRPSQSSACCVNGTCLTDGESACGRCKIPGTMFGEHVARFVEQNNETLGALTFISCWYPKSRRGLEEMSAASNSLWKERHRWIKPGNMYIGWTECTATLNIRSQEMIDAIVAPLFVDDPAPDLGLCDYWDRQLLLRKLQYAYDSGFGALPVVFLSRSPGDE